MSTHKSPAAIDPSEWITQAEAARLRKVSRQAIGRLVESGRLRTVQMGGRPFVNRSEVLTLKRLPAGRRKKSKA
jgi:excisionase family DNA binding protein